MTHNTELQKAERLDTIRYPANHDGSNGNGTLYNTFFPTVESGLRWLNQRYEEQSGIRMEFKNGAGSVAVDRDTNFLIFHTAYELLDAIYRHGTAENVLVSIASTGHRVEMRIEDDGEGFDVSGAASLMAYTQGHSLQRLTAELTSFGGDLHLESKADAGTRVTISVPLSADEPRPAGEGMS